ncbi:f4954846-59da-4468-a20f-d3a015b49ccd [Sclerotinia trifoliorum]|uniref:Lysosomal dipeptide transporter MFSD1 n=1 Tax=Sclerotinia trifoliorum TaxID=28548 RepID=A0A8H2ZNE0_9HELO|nr:f4954846-59da-4468-a20f-d3a015b49ccd [Sclerotinia trifoliorum]
MSSDHIAESDHPTSVTPSMGRDAKEKDETVVSAASASVNEENSSGIANDERPNGNDIPLKWKLASILLVSMIGFGSHWSSGITGAMKSTIKKEMKINNKQYALLSSSQDFMVTALMLVSGVVTDRIGGAGAIFYGNIIFTIGSVLIAGAAQTRNYQFMIGGTIVQAFGDIATQVAQYKVFSSWFAPNHGFASTLALELGIGKIGAFVGKSSANIISQNTGNFANVYWVSVAMNLFCNFMTLGFYIFTRYANKKFPSTADPATGEKLTEGNKSFELRKVLELPWTFWVVLSFSLFETSVANIFTNNATEMAEQRLGVSSVRAGWYTAAVQYGGFFFVPLIGIFVDIWGNRITLFAVMGLSVLTSMSVVNWAPSIHGTDAAFGIYAFAYCFGPTLIVDSIRTSMWHQSVFGSAVALKLTLNNAMSIIVNIVAGVIQDADHNSYNKVTNLYVALAAGAAVIALLMVLLSYFCIDFRILQYTREQRVANGQLINDRKERFHNMNGGRNRKVSMWCFAGLVVLVAGSWCAYFWGVVTGHNNG